MSMQQEAESILQLYQRGFKEKNSFEILIEETQLKNLRKIFLNSKGYSLKFILKSIGGQILN